MANRLILGIDPGLNITGYGVVEWIDRGPVLREAGVIRGQNRRRLDSRLVDIHDGVTEVLAAFQPDVMAVEDLFSHYERPRTAILMGHARGVICLAAAQASVQIESFAATHVKKMLTGNGRASKQQVQLAVCNQFGLAEPPEPVDVTDAIAIALCECYSSQQSIRL